jgi:hypothetical protein
VITAPLVDTGAAVKVVPLRVYQVPLEPSWAYTTPPRDAIRLVPDPPGTAVPFLVTAPVEDSV